MLRASSFIVETGTIDIQWRSSGSRPGYSLGRNVTATWTERNWWIIFDQTSRTPINQQIPTYKSTFPSLSLSKFSRFVFIHPFLALSFFFFSSPFFFDLIFRNFAGIGKHHELMVVQDESFDVNPSRGPASRITMNYARAGTNASSYTRIHTHTRAIVRQVRQTRSDELCPRVYTYIQHGGVS